jgi:hypothetical protein
VLTKNSRCGQSDSRVRQGLLGAEWPESLVKRLQGVAESMKRFRTAMQTRI